MKQKHKHTIIRIFLLAALMIFTFSSVFAQSNETLAQSAAKAYQKGDYKSSIESYNKIVSSGSVSSKLYYNLGNSYYKNDELGKAIYNFELAAKLDPTDQDVRHNLMIANKKKKDEIEQKENYFAQQVQSGILFLFSTTGWAWISIISLALSLLLFGLYKLSSSTGFRKFFFWLGSVNLIVCLFSLIIGSMALNETTAKNHAIILSDEVKVFNSPAENAVSQFMLHEGTKVKILETNEEWTSIILDNGNEGWLLTKDIGVF